MEKALPTMISGDRRREVDREIKIEWGRERERVKYKVLKSNQMQTSLTIFLNNYLTSLPMQVV